MTLQRPRREALRASLQHRYLVPGEASATMRGEESGGATAGDHHRPLAYFHRLDPVAAGLLVRLQLQQTALLRFQEQVVKRTESVSALVETGVAALDRLLDHRTPDRLVRLALLGDGFQRFHHQVKRLFQRRPFVLAFRRLRRGALVAVRRRARDGSARTRSS